MSPYSCGEPDPPESLKCIRGALGPNVGGVVHSAVDASGSMLDQPWVDDNAFELVLHAEEITAAGGGGD